MFDAWRCRFVDVEVLPYGCQSRRNPSLLDATQRRGSIVTASSEANPAPVVRFPVEEDGLPESNLWSYLVVLTFVIEEVNQYALNGCI